MDRRERERVNEARRAGLRGRLLTAWRLPEERAEGLLEDWEARVDARGLGPADRARWDGAAEWLAEKVGRASP